MAFTDANHGDITLSDWLSISRGAYYLGGLLIHWTCQKQHTPAHSSVESELITASDTAWEVIWLSHITKEFGYAGPIEMKVDNKVAVDIANAHGLTRRVKHIELRDAYIWIMWERGIICVTQIPSEDNAADLFTKAFQSPVAFINAHSVTLNAHQISESAGECQNIPGINFLDVK